MSKQDEFNTWDHIKMLEGEIPEFDVRVMAVYGAIRRGVQYEDALAEYDLSSEQYKKNIERCLS